jgi:hypothetical protein
MTQAVFELQQKHIVNPPPPNPSVPVPMLLSSHPTVALADIDGGTCIINFVIVYLVKRRGSPVLYIEIKPPQDLEDKSSCIAADDQMRNRMSSMREALTIPTLYAISAMGTTFSLYTRHNEHSNITPHFIPCQKNYVNDATPTK